MTFVVKTRGAGGLFLAEYMCPEHGRFEQLVQRNESGDPPAKHPCDADDGYGEMCFEICELTVSAPKPKVLSVPATAVTRGGDLKDRPPGMLDTRPLAEGMPMSEWRKVQKKHSEERRHQQLIERGLKTKRIQSP